MEVATWHWCLKKKKMSKFSYKITDFVRIKDHIIFHRKEPVFKAESSLDLDQFLKQTYQNLKIAYPKFHKMDGLCKLGILASEVLFKDHFIPPETALVFSNSASSLETDKKHQQAMGGMVSPAVFVYTLPNIVLGEISIKHKLQSENVFFVENRFNPQLLTSYAEVLLEAKKTPAVVCGWIDLKNAEYDVFLCLISKEGEIPLSEENLKQLYLFENE